MRQPGARTRKPFASRRLSTPGFWATLAIVVLAVAYVQVLAAGRPDPAGRRIDFSTLVRLAEKGEVRTARVLSQDSYVEGVYQRAGAAPVAFNTPYLEMSGTSLVDALAANGVQVQIDGQYGKKVLPELAVLLPTLILIVVLAYFIVAYRRGVGVFGQRSGARRATAEDTTLRYADIAAQDAAVAELREISQFLSDPERFAKLGARVPKGVLLYGPPGCGKTLLARAVAGESGAAFYSISGSDFVEMFVGVGASRVRELFKQARENAPAIVFIDEIDAVARKRQSVGTANGEQNQALNQLLTEMDGFSREPGTIVIGATNRPDDLDAALLRPGRFDRTVSVDRPDAAGRAAILELHARSKPLAAGVDLAAIAARAIGFTGADLESVTNEAALLSARTGRSDITQRELDEALTRILEAPERQRRLTMRDRTMGQQSLGGERVTFADVAGVGPALTELTEIRDFLREPARFSRAGARFPRGFLLVGPPGTGKTLLARAVAGEANAAFLSVAATEFTEVFVGEGAARVRDLFGQARAMAPAIVFIDEVDAIGARRGSAASVDGHREREQTLNQILVELDGFRQRDGVIVMAATNRPEILDPALVRAGRFDRAITVDLPDREGRRAILAVHIGEKRLAADVDLDAIAGITRGLSGADLANVMNEAALLSARHGREEIVMATLEEAVERGTMGIARGHVLSDAERHVVAVHEAGHVVVARGVPDGRLPHLVSIIPAGDSLGRAWLVDTHDRAVRSRSGLVDEMAVLLGGRSAEALVFGEAGSSAASDLAQVARIARHMVSELGMSEVLGPVGYSGATDSDGRALPVSEATARTIDEEARRFVREAQGRADAVLAGSREVLERVAAALAEAETLSAKQIEELATQQAPARTG